MSVKAGRWVHSHEFPALERAVGLEIGMGSIRVFENALGGAETRASGFAWVGGEKGRVNRWVAGENMIKIYIVVMA
jgi:hypothetical protein